jgi:hypothetical protein
LGLFLADLLDGAHGGVLGLVVGGLLDVAGDVGSDRQREKVGLARWIVRLARQALCKRRWPAIASPMISFLVWFLLHRRHLTASTPISRG